MVDVGMLFQKMLIMVLMMAVGFVAGKAKVMTEESNHSLSVIINKITMPCMVLYSALNNEHALSNAQVMELVVLALGSYVVLILLSKLFTLIVRPEKGHRGLYEFILIFANQGFIGIPVISAVYGTDAVFYLSIFIIVFFLVLYSYGTCLVQEIPMKNVDFRQMLSPMMIASVLGLVLYLCNVRLPQILTDTIGSLSQVSTPGAMLMTGAALTAIPLKGLFRNGRLFLASAAKLLLVPIALNLVFRLFIKDEMMLGIVTLASAMPVASNLSLLAAQYGKDEDLAASAVFITTVLSVVTIPLVAMLLL